MTKTPSTIAIGGLASLEQSFAELLADALGAEQMPVDSHLFDDLGADSILMARFYARVRKRTDLPSVSMKDVYQHPTITSLASALAPAGASPLRPSRSATQRACNDHSDFWFKGST